MIFDTFTLDWELDLLECRLTELASEVDWFVLCEATTTQSTGEPKPLHFAENLGRFARWLPKIMPVAVKNLPAGDDPWAREKAQRNAIMTGLKWAGAGPGDLLLYSDVDEIPTVGAIRAAADLGVPCVFDQVACYYAVDWIAPWIWEGTCACRAGDVGSIAEMREARAGWLHLPLAGWHLSWLGGPEGIRRKLANRAHTDETSWYLEQLAAGRLYEGGIVSRSYSGDPVQMEPVDVDASWPRWVAERRCPPEWFRPR
jgi:Glycosyltransferase family 17